MNRSHTPESFWALADKTDECWNWSGSIHRLGYGQVRWGGGFRKAHRVAYELAIGPIPDGLELDHLCRNRRCVRPDHLEPVTHAENVRRGRVHKTTCRNGHPYEGNLVIDTASGARRCRTCRNAQSAERKRRVRVHTGPLLAERHPNAKITDEDVRVIRASTDPPKAIAERYGISRGSVWLIRTRRTWASVH